MDKLFENINKYPERKIKQLNRVGNIKYLASRPWCVLNTWKWFLHGNGILVEEIKITIDIDQILLKSRLLGDHFF